VSFIDGAVAGYEALVRWEHPELGLIPPAEFIPVAEESGLIIALGDWVLRESCRQAALWQHSGRRFRLAVNVSARQFQQKDYSAALLRMLAESDYDPHLLELEITEDTLVKQHDDVIEAMSALSRAGVTLSIKHFGTGYSSLAYLKRLPIRKIKIDPSFIHDLANPDAATIVRATIQLARSLSLQVVAEGIETTAQFEFLRAAGCDLGQGFHTGRPLPPVS
jgi:EAL domain-containing protein (putative c-di-GMP-specific phosphodiesterase class I)